MKELNIKPIEYTRRETQKDWSGIECCACGNLIENCHFIKKI